jgi:hypothetical protein
MTRAEIIRKACDTLIDDRELNAILNRTGSVCVAVLPDISPQVSWRDPGPPDYQTTDHRVTFTIEETAFGRRLMAEYDGMKEFVA